MALASEARRLGQPRAVRGRAGRSSNARSPGAFHLREAGALTSGQAFQPLISRAEMGLGMEYPMGGRMWWYAMSAAAAAASEQPDRNPLAPSHHARSWHNTASSLPKYTPAGTEASNHRPHR